MYIVTRYEFNNNTVRVIYTVDNFRDSLHLCFDKILEDINEYKKEETDQVVINTPRDITMFRRGMIQGKYELFHYVVHDYKDDDDNDNEDED